MILTISILRCPDTVPPQTRKVTGGELSIGRGTENDWMLPDPDRVLSKRHCVIAFRQGGWQVADVSSNGTFVNREREPIGPGRLHPLQDGDRLRLGSYEMELRLEEDEQAGFGLAAGRAAASAPAAVSHQPSFGQALPHQSAFAADPFGDDPFASPTPQRDGGAFRSDPLLRQDQQANQSASMFGSGVALPADFDPMATDHDNIGFSGPTQADHTPAIADVFQPPGVSRLPDDWAIEFAAPPTSPVTITPPAPHSANPFLEPDFLAQPPARPPHAPAMPPVDLPDDFRRQGAIEAPAPSAQTAPSPLPVPQMVPTLVPAPLHAAVAMPVAAPGAAPGAALVATPVAAPVSITVAATPPPLDLFAAFLAGAEMEDIRPADPLAAMRGLGAAFRATVSGIRQTLIARATVKSEFRIEQTMIRARGNNPLKFSAGDDDALAALIGAGRRTDMPAAEAVADALRDIRMHELATMAAMQSAVRAMLKRLDPQPLREEGEKAGGMIPAQRRARAFDLYEKLHHEISLALADDFDSVFGKAFARAYELALREASEKETRS